jgi:hypothetical protein
LTGAPLPVPASADDNGGASSPGVAADARPPERWAPPDHDDLEELTMASPRADHDLLFGLLALQNGLINQGQLVAAFQAWTLEKDRPLAGHLIDRGDLDPDDRAAVEALVARHLKKHGGSPVKSLAALPAGLLTRLGSSPSTSWARWPIAGPSSR